MPRIGQFSGRTFQRNMPLSIVHPPDNVILGTQYHELLREKMGELTAAQLDDLERQIRELEAIGQLNRETLEELLAP